MRNQETLVSIVETIIDNEVGLVSHLYRPSELLAIAANINMSDPSFDRVEREIIFLFEIMDPLIKEDESDKQSN